MALARSDGFKLCDGQVMGVTSDHILLDYIPRDKQVSRLRYRLVLKNDQTSTVCEGQVAPSNQTDFAIEFTIEINGQ
jgi:hypothetical protein